MNSSPFKNGNFQEALLFSSIFKWKFPFLNGELFVIFYLDKVGFVVRKYIRVKNDHRSEFSNLSNGK